MQLLIILKKFQNPKSSLLTNLQIPMTESRFSRGKDRLILAEQAIQKKKSISRKLGKTLPEETIKIPKIGEWSLSDKEIHDTPELKHIRSKTRNASPTGNRKENGLLSSMSKSPPQIIHPPRVNPANMISSDGHTNFPQGTVSTNVIDILKSRYRVLKRPIPPLKPKNDDEIPEPQFLPLEMFDDSTFEEYPISELMKNPYAYSRYQEIDGDNYWAPCTVLDYDEENRIFTIEWDNDTRKRKRVARFNLRFEQEDPDKFDKRIQIAKKLCTQHEYLLRFEARVEQMPTINLPQLSPSNLDEMHSKMAIAVNSPYASILDQLDEEVRQEFQKVNNRLEYKWIVEHNPLVPNREEFMQIFKPPPPIPENGLIPHNEVNFQDLLEYTAENSLMASPHIQSGIYKIWGIFQDSMNSTFLTNGFSDTLTLEEFISRQFAHLDTTTKKFKNSIQGTLDSVISATVTESIDNAKPKEKQKYQNMVNLTTRMLHTVLLKIIQNTVEYYLSLYAKYLTDERLKLHPQFSIIFQLDENKQISFSPTIDKFKSQLSGLLTQL